MRLSPPPRLALLTALTCVVLGAAPAAAETLDLAREACAASQTGQHQHAMALSQQLVDSKPHDGSAWRVHAYVLSRAEHPDLALTAYEEAIKLDPRDVIALNNAASLMLKQDRAREALMRIRDVLLIAPRYADARNNRGVALERLGRLHDAENAYRGATMVNPRHARAHNNLGAVRLRRGEVQGAATAFRRAMEIDPRLAAPRLNLALVQERGRSDAAFVEALEAQADAPGADVALRVRALAARAGQLAFDGDMEGARTKMLAALALDPQNAALLNNAGVIEDQLGNDRDAMLHLQAALESDPQLHVVRNNIGIVHVHRGDLDLAKGVFRNIIEDAPRFYRAHYNLGVIYASQGEIHEALAALRRASQIAPDDPDTIYNLGLVRSRMGAPRRVEYRYYQRALRLNPHLVEAHLGLGTLMADPETPARLRNPAQARVHLQRFLELVRPGDQAGREQAEGWLRWLDARSG